MIGGTIIKIIEWERQKICDDLLDHVIDYNSSLWFLLLWSTCDEIMAAIGWVCNSQKNCWFKQSNGKVLMHFIRH